MDYVPWQGFGPFESYEADHTVAGGETLELAGLTIDVIFTPGHSPGHVTYAIPAEDALFSGDVLFQGSVGRVDLPGGDWPTLLGSIEPLLEAYPAEATVYPGHMGITTLGRERATNPFLRELAPELSAAIQAPRGTFDVLPEDAARRALVEAHAKRILEGRRLRPDRDADVRGHRAVRPRGRRGDRHRPEGDVLVRRRAAAAR